MLARIVVGRPLDEPNQQREFTDVELGERLGEVELAAESEAMYRARPVLAEIHFVQVRDQNVLLGKVRLEPQRHHGLGCLSTDGLFVRQEVVLDELLRQRAAALNHMARPKVGPQRAQDTQRVDAVVLVKTPVLDQLDRRAQQWRHIGRRQHDAIFAVDGKHAADQERIEAEHR